MGSWIHSGKEGAGLGLEFLIFGIPLRIVRRIDDLLQLAARVPATAIVEHQLREEEMRGGASGVVLERLPKMRFRVLPAPPEQTRHLRIPSSQRAVRGALEKCLIDPQHRFELFFDRAAILEAESR